MTGIDLSKVLEIISRELVAAAVLGGAVALGILFSFLTRRILRGLAKRRDSFVLQSLVKRFRGPMRLLYPLIFLTAVSSIAPMSDQVASFFAGALKVAFIVDIAWITIRIFASGEEFVLERYTVDVTDNLKARKVHTQIRVITRILNAGVIFLAFAAILVTFNSLRQLGTTLLASAGIVGIIVGFAAQKSLGMLLAGLQVALAQPIRIDDVVVVEGEWGRIEEITLTYVVVKIWDWRRMVLPITYFIDTPFQNWTRVSSQLLGSVYLYVDYDFDVEQLRSKLHEFLQESSLWDRTAWVLQVTDAGEKSMQLRALMTAKDSPTLWDLRCEIREKLITYVRENHPDKLPRFRAELEANGTDLA